jgi:hypothetical protein
MKIAHRRQFLHLAAANPENRSTGLTEGSGLTHSIAKDGDPGGDRRGVHPPRSPQHRRAERQEILRSDAFAARCREVSLQLRSCLRRGGRKLLDEGLVRVDDRLLGPTSTLSPFASSCGLRNALI